MKHIRILVGMIVVALTTVPPYAVSAAEQQENQMVGQPIKTQKEVPPIPAATQPGTLPQPNDNLSNNKPAAAMPTLLYKPPLGLGAPTGLVAGGSRGTTTCLSGDPGNEHTALMLSVLAPADHIGLTVHEQPSLYWYLSAPTDCQVEVTLTDEQAVEPLLELSLSPPINSGVQRVRLADHNVHLAPGAQYQWAVALVPDPEHRSKDIIATGGIKRIEATKALQAKLTQADMMEAATLYAEAGLWYDTVAAISDLIIAAPQDPTLRIQRAALLEQVRLPEVAEYERKLSYQQKNLGH
jgi:Domain of Unknown Function (DUF928)